MLFALNVNCPECGAEVYVTLDNKTNDLIDCTGCGMLFYAVLEIQDLVSNRLHLNFMASLHGVEIVYEDEV